MRTADLIERVPTWLLRANPENPEPVGRETTGGGTGVYGIDGWSLDRMYWRCVCLRASWRPAHRCRSQQLRSALPCFW